MAETVFKNIQVLKGVPVDELMDTMGVFAAGTAAAPTSVEAKRVTCYTCHGFMTRAILVLVTASVFWAPSLYAQTESPAPSATPTAPPFVINGPAAPEPPATISRDASGRATARATRLRAPLRIDGKLDEEVYERVPPMSDFIQVDPDERAPATEKTEVWVLFDDEAVYVVGRCWETEPERTAGHSSSRSTGYSGSRTGACKRTSRLLDGSGSRSDPVQCPLSSCACTPRRGRCRVSESSGAATANRRPR